MMKLFFIVCCSLFLNGNAEQCFTMPPKKNEMSWSIFGPDLNSPDYVHNVHECPPSYSSFLKYSHFVKEPLIWTSEANQLYVMSYNVCCH